MERTMKAAVLGGESLVPKVRAEAGRLEDERLDVRVEAIYEHYVDALRHQGFSHLGRIDVLDAHNPKGLTTPDNVVFGAVGLDHTVHVKGVPLPQEKPIERVEQDFVEGFENRITLRPAPKEPHPAAPAVRPIIHAAPDDYPEIGPLP
jgi:hypothetical protein